MSEVFEEWAVPAIEAHLDALDGEAAEEQRILEEHYDPAAVRFAGVAYSLLAAAVRLSPEQRAGFRARWDHAHVDTSRSWREALVATAAAVPTFERWLARARYVYEAKLDTAAPGPVVAATYAERAAAIDAAHAETAAALAAVTVLSRDAQEIFRALWAADYPGTWEQCVDASRRLAG